MLRKRPRDESDESSESKDLVRRDQDSAPAAPRLLASLEVSSGPDKGQSFPLTRMITLIGRDDTCDIVLSDESVSREHGQIEQHMADWVYTNLSDNGSLINRKKVERLVLKNGDTIEVGGETRMRFRLAEPEQVEVAPAVRRRVRVRHGEETEEEVREHPQPQIGESLLKRRKLLVGIGVYLMAMLALVIVFKMSGKKEANESNGPVREWKGSADIDAYLDFDFPNHPVDPRQANVKLNDAHQKYQNWKHGDPMNLWDAVKDFQESEAYRGGPLPFKDDRIYVKARAELRDNLWQLYRSALICEVQGRRGSTRDYYRQKARNYYREMQRRVDGNNPIFAHIQGRIAGLSRL